MTKSDEAAWLAANGSGDGGDYYAPSSVSLDDADAEIETDGGFRMHAIWREIVADLNARRGVRTPTA